MKSKNVTETQKNICAVDGKGAVTDRTCQKWFEQFRARDFLLHDAPQPGRPVEVDSDQIGTLIEDNQCYTTRETAKHTQNIQINKVIGGNEKCVLYLWKKPYGLFGQPNNYLVILGKPLSP